jgi:hypothetical protein
MERFPVDELLAAWSRGWTSGDAKGLAELWDQDYANLTFLPTERDDAIRTWDGVREYYEQLVATFKPDTWTTSDVIVDRLTPEIVFLRTKMRMEYRLADFEGEPASFWRGRCQQTWRWNGSAWKLIHKEDSTNEFDRAVNIMRRLEAGAPVADILAVNRNWSPFVPKP